MKLDDLLSARRTMDYAATSLPKEIYGLAKDHYQTMLKNYNDEQTKQGANPEQLQLFLISEQDRIESLTEFNDTRSNYVYPGNNDAVRERAADLRSAGPGL